MAHSRHEARRAQTQRASQLGALLLSFALRNTHRHRHRDTDTHPAHEKPKLAGRGTH